ncbi:methyltransferase domain-containing protein [bacterium]|nr:methyltransferase domain-containing protein [bacterium]
MMGENMNGAASVQESGKGEGAVGVASLMAEIRRRTADEVSAAADERLSFRTHAGDFNKKRKAGELLHSEELRYLNEHYHYSVANSLDDIQSHRGGFLGRVVVALKRRLANFLWEGFFRSYFEREKAFQAKLVRLLNTQAKYIDERDASNFWELVHKVDVDVSKAIERAERLQDEFVAEQRSSERRLHEAVNAELTKLASQVAELRAEAAGNRAELETVSKVAHGLESITSRLSKEREAPVVIPGEKENGGDEAHDGVDYLLLENRFRGSEEEIAERLRQYAEDFRGVPGEVLDIGCGRGELLEILRAEETPARGVDLDRGMISVAAERGLAVTQQDGFEALEQVSSGTLGGVIAIQVIEHLPPRQVEDLVRLAYDRLAPGGKLILETINPKSVLALSSNYFRDPTHIFPQHPDTLSYLCTKNGFVSAPIRYLSPVPDEALLKEIAFEDYMTPRWQFFVQQMNENIHRLNGLLYGYQDFAVVAEKGAGQ